jgi:tetratricopeptide (TPR) repeat protein
LKKTWYRITSKTSNLAEAKIIAEDVFHEARVLEKRGLSVVSKKFKAVAQVVCDNLKEQVKAGTGKKSYADYYRAIDTYLIPFFGAYNINRVSQEVFSQFCVWRREKVGRELSHSAQANHNAALSRVFDIALEKGYMTQGQLPVLAALPRDAQRRADFTLDEYRQLFRFMRGWIKQGKRVEEGLALITRAAESRPDQGYIVDSLGWAYFQLGDYEQAVIHCERAVELLADERQRLQEGVEGLFGFVVERARAEPRQMFREGAHRLRDRHLVVVQDDEEVAVLDRARVVQRFERHA